ncbi:hydroxylamine reductase [Parelusimicrobium proximum]|uniref:hydroxylamine reductase n=1 Tax=Parelusimicrobium proximum TaxID=3228953 RepID=UPI003D16FCDE
MSMFCFQCEQTMKGTGCTIAGVCGKQEDTAHEQDKLTAEIINLSRAALKGKRTKESDKLIVDSLFTCVTNVDFDTQVVVALKDKVIKEREKIEKENNIKVDLFDYKTLWEGDKDDVSLRSALLFGMRGMAAYAHHARVLGKEDDGVNAWFYKGLVSIGDKHTADERLNLIMEFGKINLRCMEILDEANTGAYGTPEPTKVTHNIEKGPFIIVTGHDLKDLDMLLKQSEGKGVNIYTHGEMLPCHAYPELKKYKHLKGNFGTAWQNQQKEFSSVPAPILFTTNCIMIPQASYKDNVYTTSVVAFPGVKHIEAAADGHKDFSAIIEHAVKLGGYAEDKKMTGINGGDTLTVGFGRGTVLGVADKVIDAVKTGAIKHFFLVGGCDGAKPGRNYYTEFVKQSPKDTVILTLACGKYRFNDLDIGEIGGLPRIMDMGQCNDAYSAIQVALALAKAFNVGVNELPLTLVLSWYEQKAVCILLTLLSLGIKNIYLGPTMPAFLSEDVRKIIIDKFNLKPVSTPEEDLKAILGK